jgi:hypothetical protein
MSTAAATLLGFAYGEHLDSQSQRSLGFRLLAPLEAEPWCQEVEALARRLQFPPVELRPAWPSPRLDAAPGRCGGETRPATGGEAGPILRRWSFNFDRRSPSRLTRRRHQSLGDADLVSIPPTCESVPDQSGAGQ